MVSRFPSLRGLPFTLRTGSRLLVDIRARLDPALQSGRIRTLLPLSITGTNGRPIIVGNPRAKGPVNKRLGNIVVNGVPQNPYFNTAAFQQLPSQFYNVTPVTPGGVSPIPPYLGSIRALYSASLNTSVLKNFPIYERIRAQLRLETFNTTNHPTFKSPGTKFIQRRKLRCDHRAPATPGRCRSH